MRQSTMIMPSADRSAIKKYKKKEGSALKKALVNLFSKIEDSTKSMSQVALWERLLLKFDKIPAFVRMMYAIELPPQKNFIGLIHYGQIVFSQVFTSFVSFVIYYNLLLIQ